MSQLRFVSCRSGVEQGEGGRGWLCEGGGARDTRRGACRLLRARSSVAAVVAVVVAPVCCCCCGVCLPWPKICCDCRKRKGEHSRADKMDDAQRAAKIVAFLFVCFFFCLSLINYCCLF